jgi:GNAT superfamily N-acetyltransferase
MSRSAIALRKVRVEDAPHLLELWEEFSRRPADGHDAAEELAQSIRSVLASGDARIVVAEHNGSFAGAVHLSLQTMGPFSSERAVQISHLRVAPDHRRRGVGRALVEAAVAWAEDLGVAHVGAVSVNSRAGNRFLARLGLAPVAVMRVGPTAQVRAKIPVELPTVVRPVASRPLPPNRQLGQVLAARRSARRQQDPVEAVGPGDAS